MIIDTMFSSKTDLWATPQEFFDELDAEFHFTLDPCATPENAKCKKFYTRQENGLQKNWGGGELCSAIRRTAGRFTNGSKNVTKNQRNPELRSYYLFPHVPTLGISMSSFTIKPEKFDS